MSLFTLAPHICCRSLMDKSSPQTIEDYNHDHNKDKIFTMNNWISSLLKRQAAVLDECSDGANFVSLMSTDKSQDQLQTEFQQHHREAYFVWNFTLLTICGQKKWKSVCLIFFTIGSGQHFNGRSQLVHLNFQMLSRNVKCQIYKPWQRAWCWKWKLGLVH